LEDKSGVLWVGTGNGLNQFDREKEQFIRHPFDPGNPKNSDISISSIHEDWKGRLWVGTMSHGLHFFDRKTGSFSSVAKMDGLPSNQINGILEDNSENLWLHTENGIAKYNPDTKNIKVYDEKDGLRIGRNIFKAFCKNDNGEMYFGGTNGFVRFHPDKLRDNPHIPRVAITDFKIGYQTVAIGVDSPLKKSITVTDSITLSYSENDLSFEFAALDYTAPDKNQYAYIMEGFDRDWINSGTRRFANYTNLSPGEYTFRVKGSNNDGIWNEEGASLRIIINPPWWKTWWAYTLYGILLLAAFFSFRRYEINRQRLKHELELEHLYAEKEHLEAEKVKELDRLKSRFFANISHEFRTPMTLILGPLERLISQTADEKLHDTFLLMQRNGQRLLRLINQLLDLSKLEAGKMAMQAAPYDLEEVLKPLVMAFESLAGLREIELHFVPPPEPVILYLDRDKFEKIMTNLLFNAFKFTPEGESVIVDCEFPKGAGGIADSSIADMGFPEGTGRNADLKDQSEIRDPKSKISNFVKITVRDTGIGIPPNQLPHIFDRFYQASNFSYGETLQATSQQGSGIGLALTRELVELHKGKIAVESEVGEGTTFTVHLPLGKEHLQKEEIVERKARSEERDAMSMSSDQLSAISDQEMLNIEGEQAGIDQSPNRPIPKSPNPQITQSPNILIVEDNPDMHAYIRDHLKNNYRVIEAENGVEGFKKAAKEMPDLIISDVMMPQMDGFELCAKLKTDERTSHIPVILLTARASWESKIEGLETGADAYLTKPFDAKELQIRIKNLIGQRRKLRERFSKEITLQPKDITVTSADEKFLMKIMDVIEAHLSDPDFRVEYLSKEVAISRAHLHRKLQALTDLSPVEFIRLMRMKRAAKLLEHHVGNISEIAYEVGFKNPAYFAECFRKQFGISPSKYSYRRSQSLE
jgi:signal transduction histidine kinase/DNA-binding response OmpR family regulator